MLFDLKTPMGTQPLKCSGDCSYYIEIAYKPYQNIWCQGLMRSVVCPLRYYKPKGTEVCCSNAPVSAANLKAHFSVAKEPAIAK